MTSAVAMETKQHKQNVTPGHNRRPSHELGSTYSLSSGRGGGFVSKKLQTAPSFPKIRPIFVIYHGSPRQAIFSVAGQVN